MNEMIQESWGEVTLAVDRRRGRYAIRFPGFDLSGCGTFVKRDDGVLEHITWTAGTRTGDRLRLEGATRSGQWTLVFSAATNARGVPGLRLEMAGRLAKGARVTELIPLAVRSLRADHLLVHGRSAGGCEAIPLPAAREEAFRSFLQTMITRRGDTLQVAHPLRQEQPSAVHGRVKGGAVLDLTAGTPVEEGTSGRVRAEPVTMYAAADGHALMEAWAEGERGVVKTLAAVAGWNSWDYYRWTITEEAVLKNAEFIAADPVLRRHVKRIIVDDGWQYCYGEWDANPLFPHGMKWLAKRLTTLGFEPGLWIAPAVIEPHARIAQWDMDMLARGRSGLPCLAFSCMERFGFVLDPTVPKTRRWIHDLFDRYAGMGYRYFKLDFLVQTLKAPVFADPAVPRGQIVRMLVETAHQALKGRGRIMGCGYDFMAGTEFVDEVRTSGDIHAKWDCVKENVASIAGRWWAQGRLWGNDPDFALCRGPQTSVDPDLTRLRPCLVFVKPEMREAKLEPYVLATLTLDEARTLLSLVLISGGAVNLSDDLTKLNAAGLDLVRRTVAAERGGAGVPLDLFRSARPSFWVQSVRGGQRVLLVNWSDRARRVSLDLTGRDLPGGDARNFWTGEPVPVRHGRLAADLSPHACLLVEFRC